MELPLLADPFVVQVLSELALIIDNLLEQKDFCAFLAKPFQAELILKERTVQAFAWH